MTLLTTVKKITNDKQWHPQLQEYEILS